MDEWKKDQLLIKRYGSREEMGAGAAKDIGNAVMRTIAKKGEVNMIFAAAPSQNEMLKYLLTERGIDWSYVNAMHMDEYVGLSGWDPHSFGFYLREHIFGRKTFRSVHYINGTAIDPEEECLRYAKVLEKHPVDIVCLGIGENGHIAFNDPWVADFNDTELVKIVELDRVCRQQQVHDGCFEKLDEVPTHAMTLTIPALLAAKEMFCVVPALTKAEAVRSMIEGPVDETCPASILRTHPSATLYIDPDSGSLLHPVH